MQTVNHMGANGLPCNAGDFLKILDRNIADHRHGKPFTLGEGGEFAVRLCAHCYCMLRTMMIPILISTGDVTAEDVRAKPLHGSKEIH